MAILTVRVPLLALASAALVSTTWTFPSVSDAHTCKSACNQIRRACVQSSKATWKLDRAQCVDDRDACRAACEAVCPGDDCEACLDGCDAGLDACRDLQRVGARQLVDGHADRRLAVELDVPVVRLRAELDPGDVADPQQATVLDLEHHVLELLGVR